MCKLRINLKQGREITQDVFIAIIGDDTITHADVWSIVDYAIAKKRMKRGYKAVFNLYLKDDTVVKLESVLKDICKDGYHKAVKPLYLSITC